METTVIATDGYAPPDAVSVSARYAPAPGRLEVDSGDPCGFCGASLDRHPAGSVAVTVGGTPVGSHACARELHEFRSLPGLIRVHCAAPPCVCGVLPGEECRCVTAAEVANAPVLDIARRVA